jgi:hypothetical protein
MFDKKLKEAMELLGGKAVIKDGEQLYILMTAREFRKVRQDSVGGLTKQELVDKINNDIAAWKASREEEEAAINFEELQDRTAEEIRYEKPAA